MLLYISQKTFTIPATYTYTYTFIYNELVILREFYSLSLREHYSHNFLLRLFSDTALATPYSLEVVADLRLGIEF